MKASSSRFLIWATTVLLVLNGRGAGSVPANPTPGPPLAITGTVFTASGAPAPGVFVAVEPAITDPPNRLKTDANGKFTVYWGPFEIVLGRRSLWHSLFASDPEHNLAAAAAIEPGTTSVDLHLDPGLTLSLKVQRPDGTAITNATAVVGRNPGLSENTDAEGRMRIGPVLQGLPYFLIIQAPGYIEAQLDFTAKETQAAKKDLPAVVLKPANRRLAGVFLDSQGEPSVQAVVSITPKGYSQPVARPVTDNDGRFDVMVSEDSFDITANAEPGFHAEGGDTNVVIRLKDIIMGDPAGKITGTVFDPSGARVAGVVLSVTPHQFYTRRTHSHADGQFSISRYVRPGQMVPNVIAPTDRYLIVARDLEHDYAATRLVVEKTNLGKAIFFVPPGSPPVNTSNVDIHLRKGFDLTGSVQDENGKPLSGAKAVLFLTVVGRYSFSMGCDMGPPTMDQGTFTFKALPPATTYHLNIALPGYGTYQFGISEEQSQEGILRLPVIKLKPANRPLAGVVIGPDGKPVAGINVQVTGEGHPQPVYTRTDRHGFFALKVCEGPVQVTSRQDSNSRFATPRPVPAQAGDTNVMLRLESRQAPPVGPVRPPQPDIR